MDHPVTPPPNLLDLWHVQHTRGKASLNEILIKASRWGADEELKQCSNFILPDPCCGTKHQRKVLVTKLKEARRPAPKRISMNISFDMSETDVASIEKLLDQFPNVRTQVLHQL